MPVHHLRLADAEMWFQDRPGVEPATVYIHGLAATSRTFDSVVADQRLQNRRSLLPDLLGFGNSDKPDGFGYTIEDHAATVIDLLTIAAPDPFNLVGHSLGGAVAVLVAEAMADRVQRIVLAEANLDPGGGGMSLPVSRQTEQDYVSIGFASDLEQMEGRELEMMKVASPLAIHRSSISLVANTRPTIRERFVALDIPRTFLAGAWSLSAPPLPSGESGDGLREHGIDRVVVPDAGHSMLLDNPGAVAHAIADALSI